jgi:DNA mismatch repair protein MutS
MTVPPAPANTPMFEQYRSLKAQHPDAILFFRMGDFYETFFEDAVLCARELEITLTSRNKADPEPIPMAGVPVHAVAGYLQRLTDAGHRVAIAEQTEDPALAKGLVKRAIVRVVTPGVTWDPVALEGRAANWLCAVARGPGGYGVVVLDASTGDLRGTVVGQLAQAEAEARRLEPKEILFGPGVPPFVVQGALPSGLAAAEWEPAAVALAARLPGAGALPRELQVAAGAAVRYADHHLGGALGNVHALTTWEPAGHMVIDEASRRNLELSRTLAGGRKGSLLDLLDVCATNMGSRRLSEWLLFPLLDRRAIVERQDAVEVLVREGQVRRELRDTLRLVADLERLCARVAHGTATGRDLLALGRSLVALPTVVSLLGGHPELLAVLPADRAPDVGEDIVGTLVDDPPVVITEGGLIREGVDPELDALVRLSVDGQALVERMEEEERAATGISSLKIRQNRVFGYFLEVSTANLHKVPDRFLRKQTLSNCERYVTAELQELERRVTTADERRRQLELDLFRRLRVRVHAAGVRIAAVARAVATLDAACSLAEVAARAGWTRPVVDDSRDLEIVAGRHPVVEAALREERFVPNDLTLAPDTASLCILTGPNMAGKSTVLRQVASIVLLAQMGSFVPAERARVGVCDRIFTRVGASDDLRRGQSTFMVEMAETAGILRDATPRSLVVLDEIGRGTSTYDGLAIAWAVAEDLHDRVECKALFATHYHELVALADTHPRVRNLHVAVGEVGHEIVFFRTLREGGASRSYGIQCARLAGLPDAVIARAKVLLQTLEKPPADGGDRRQLSLFGAPAPTAPASAAPPPPPPDRLREALASADPDALTPRAALELVYHLKSLA